MEQETVMKKTLLTTLAVASSLAFACVANAAENNPFGLVYKGAIMENVKGKVNIHPVTYTLNGLKIAANVYTPAGYRGAELEKTFHQLEAKYFTPWRQSEAYRYVKQQ